MIKKCGNLSISLIVLIAVLSLNSCRPLYNKDYKKPLFADLDCSRPTKKLHKRLYLTSKKGFGVGHQDALSYGIDWVASDYPSTFKSDVKDVSGDFPAVYGFDIGGLENDDALNLDQVPFENMASQMKEIHKMGGLITISWHPDNPVTKGDSWDNTPAVKAILTDPAIEAKYHLWIERVAKFIGDLKYRGRAIPVIFRPMHEMNGSWFWWGNPNCTPEEYKALWKKTVKLLRDEHKLHNILYVYSPNLLESDQDYLKYYPGDEFVDILGIDIYDFYDSAKYIQSVKNDLALVKKLATERGKLHAFTETGLEKIGTEGWYNELLYPAIADSGISWILFWRNHTKSHHYAPYPGHPIENDFKKFKSRPKTLFLSDLPTLKNKQ